MYCHSQLLELKLSANIDELVISKLVISNGSFLDIYSTIVKRLLLEYKGDYFIKVTVK